MEKELKKLLKITEGCRDDMHEPDEQGLSCRIIGNHLDNALGEHISLDAITGGYQEFVIVFSRRLEHGRIEQTINLATLIALARKAKL